METSNVNYWTTFTLAGDVSNQEEAEVKKLINSDSD